MRIYLAGPIGGLTFKEATLWRNVAASKLGVRCPMRSIKNEWGDDPISDSFRADMLLCYTRDLYDVRRSDIILANFSIVASKKCSPGTTFEIGYAKALNKTIVIVGPEENIPLFVRMAADIHFQTLDEAINYLLDFDQDL